MGNNQHPAISSIAGTISSCQFGEKREDFLTDFMPSMPYTLYTTALY